jgi:hypothetical protein
MRPVMRVTMQKGQHHQQTRGKKLTLDDGEDKLG